MRFQATSWDCGPTAAGNAARALGIVPCASLLRAASGARPNGASEAGVLSALRAAGLSASEYASDSRDDAWRWLHGCLIQGRPVVLCVNSWSHWVAVVALLGAERVAMVDSTWTRRNRRENGIHFLTKQQLMRRWYNARRWADGERRLYAICAGKA